MPNKILIVDDEAIILRGLATVLSRAGFDVLTASNAPDGLELFEREDPYLVFTDLNMPGMDGFELLKKIKAASPQTIVVVMTGYGTEEHLARVLAAGGDNYMKKPLDIGGMVAMAEGYREVATQQEQMRLAQHGLTGLELRLELGSEPDAAAGAAQLIVHELEPFLPIAEVMSVRLGIFEMLQNAVEHGSLEVLGDEKREALEDGRYKQLLAERREDPRLAARRVRVRVKADRELCVVHVSDEGPGFQWQEWMETSPEHRLMEVHGRGIVMTRFYFDEIVYNELGNEVKLIKKIPPPATVTRLPGK